VLVLVLSRLLLFCPLLFVCCCFVCCCFVCCCFVCCCFVHCCFVCCCFVCCCFVCCCLSAAVCLLLFVCCCFVCCCLSAAVCLLLFCSKSANADHRGPKGPFVEIRHDAGLKPGSFTVALRAIVRDRMCGRPTRTPRIACRCHFRAMPFRGGDLPSLGKGPHFGVQRLRSGSDVLAFYLPPLPRPASASSAVASCCIVSRR
jgi:hypothetical protein